MEKISTPHDRYFRSVMTDIRVARDFFKHNLPERIKKIIDLNSLNLCKESYIDEHLKLGITDILYSANIQQQSAYLYLLVEHQSSEDELMPFRILKYICDIMDHHMNKTKGKILPIVVPMVFYHGKKAYSHSTDILDLFGENKALAEEIQFKPFKLIDMSQIPDEEIRQRQWSGIMEFVTKHIDARNFMRYLELSMSLLNAIAELNGHDYIIKTLKYIVLSGRIKNEQAFVEIVEESLPTLGDDIMTLAEIWLQRGMNQGLEKGFEQGRHEGEMAGKFKGKLEGKLEGKQEIAQKLLIRGYSISEIVQITGLSEEALVELEMTETG